MAHLKDKSGNRYGKLTVIGNPKRNHDTTYLLCKCDCGTEKYIRAENLGRTTNSCGCIRSQIMHDRQFKHGQDGTPTYRCWVSMRFRCSNPNHHRWKDYGGRGIRVCERWESFENFYADMGNRPDGYSIERINVNGNYEPSNCKWIPLADQSKNRRICLEG